MGAIETVSLDGVPAHAELRRKKKRYGYLAWLCLGSHHLYLGRPIRQLLFWLTLGGLLLWWLADFFRLPAMIADHNRRTAQNLIPRFQGPLDQRLAYLETLAFAASDPPSAPAPVETEPRTYHVAAFAEDAPPRPDRGTGPALVLTSALAAAVALYVFNPPPLFPHSAASFRAVRQVNVRDLPSTASPIRGVVAKETVLSGKVEAVAGGTARWLKIGRGSHSGGYVAVQNLESL